MYFIAKKFYTLQANIDYLPGKGHIPENQKTITAVHCIAQPKGEIIFRTINGQICKFPPEAFVPGAIYPFEIRQANEAAALCFIGLSE
jgi:hypothetical protein